MQHTQTAVTKAIRRTRKENIGGCRQHHLALREVLGGPDRAGQHALFPFVVYDTFADLVNSRELAFHGEKKARDGTYAPASARKI